MTIAVGVNTDGRREVLVMVIEASEAKPFWAEFLRDLVRHGISGVRLVISDAHEGIKAATARVLSTTWQRCRVGLLKKALTSDSLCLWQVCSEVSDAGTSVLRAA